MMCTVVGTAAGSTSLPDEAAPRNDAKPNLPEMLMDFLRRMSFTLPTCPCRDIELEERVRIVTQTWPFEDRIRQHIVTGVACAQASFPHLDIDARVAIAIYTSLLTSLDDQNLFNVLGARDFSRMLCDGSICRDEGMLGQLAKVLTDIHRHFPPFGSHMIVAATLRWFGGEMMASPFQPSSFDPHSKGLVDYQRWMSGNGEAYASFIWNGAEFPDETVWMNVLPDAILFINHTNDILSFYKEEPEHDTTSYIHARARVADQSPYQILQEVIDETVAAAERVRQLLGKGPVRDAWDSFESGYIRFHIDAPRYRLGDIIVL